MSIEDILPKPLIFAVIGVNTDNQMKIVEGLLTKASSRDCFKKVLTDNVNYNMNVEVLVPMKPKQLVSSYMKDNYNYWHTSLKNGDIIIADISELLDLGEKYNIRVCIPEKDVTDCNEEILSTVINTFGLLTIKV